MAEANGEFPICNLLVRKCKKKRIRYKKALHVCAKESDIDNCKIHIKSVHLNETDEKMRTPLYIAIIFTSDTICDLLLRYGADVHAKDSYMDDPIQLVFYYGRFELRETFYIIFQIFDKIFSFFIVPEKTDSFLKCYSLSSIR